ncbi:MAG: AMP-binding protein, partial [Gammaproteobacteria bacterium]|nr:AMP-binding protein [Gammaproteobacteria bacterium]
MNIWLRALRWTVAAILKPLFRVRVSGIEHVAEAGDRVLMVCNHLSYLDGLLLYLYLPEPPRFAINAEVAALWYFKPFLWFADLSRIDPTNPLETKTLIKYLREDKRALMFPEGRITVTGSIMKVYEGPGLVADKADAMVLPIALDGPQFSRVSRMQGRLKLRMFPRVTIKILPPRRLALPEDLQGSERRERAAHEMRQIMLEIAFAASFERETLFEGLITAAERHGYSRLVLEDAQQNRLTFRQLISRCFMLGGVMAKKTAPGDRVGVLLPNSVACAVSLFALQAYGRVAAMLNFTAGPQGLRVACETGQIKTVYTSRRFVEMGELDAVIDALNKVVEVVYLEDLRGQIGPGTKLRGLAAAWMPRRAYRSRCDNRDPDAASCVLFTSGSEGVPKGVVLSHANLLANRAQVQMLIDLTPQDTVLNALPLFHCFGLMAGLLLGLLDGARIYLYPTPLHYRIIPELFYGLQATCMFATNTFLSGYARYAHPYDFFTLRYVIAGAEKLQEDT